MALTEYLLPSPNGVLAVLLRYHTSIESIIAVFLVWIGYPASIELNAYLKSVGITAVTQPMLQSTQYQLIQTPNHNPHSPAITYLLNWGTFLRTVIHANRRAILD